MPTFINHFLPLTLILLTLLCRIYLLCLFFKIKIKCIALLLIFCVLLMSVLFWYRDMTKTSTEHLCQKQKSWWQRTLWKMYDKWGWNWIGRTYFDNRPWRKSNFTKESGIFVSCCSKFNSNKSCISKKKAVEMVRGGLRLNFRKRPLLDTSRLQKSFNDNEIVFFSRSWSQLSSRFISAQNQLHQ